MSNVLGKVTAFVTRQSKRGSELLLFRHPHAGIQIPAGTVEPGEMPEQAALREGAEETGLPDLSICEHLGCQERRLPPEQRAILDTTTVYARPDVTSFGWVHIPRGIRVALTGRHADGFSQVTYDEEDRYPDPQYLTMSITGWVPDEALADTQKRDFFRLTCPAQTEETWTVFTDNHLFTLFWSPLHALPQIVEPQRKWLEYLFRSRFNGHLG